MPVIISRARVVHVVKTGGTLYGVHVPMPAPTPRAPAATTATATATHILGFRDREHALALAVGLREYHARHGTFPPRDLDMCGGEPLPVVDYADPSSPRGGVRRAPAVTVEAVPVSRMMARLEGTGILLSVIGNDGNDDEEDLEWHDLPSRSDMPFVIDKLAWMFTLTYEAALLPKPCRRTSWLSRLGLAWACAALGVCDGLCNAACGAVMGDWEPGA